MRKFCHRLCLNTNQQSIKTIGKKRRNSNELKSIVRIIVYGTDTSYQSAQTQNRCEFPYRVLLRGGLGMETSVNPKKYPHLFGMSIALTDSRSFQSQKLPNVSFCCSISHQFPRLLAKREITANANLYVWAQCPVNFLFLIKVLKRHPQASQYHCR